MIRVVIAAHNEATVIAGILDDISKQTYENYSLTTLADRCDDETERIASEYGNVAERDSGADGKGAALAWYLDMYPLADDEALVVLDADNRVSPDLLAQISDALEHGAQVVQCYLDVLHPDSSPLTTASALTYWAGNRMVQLARANRGWSVDLGGTGMALTERGASLRSGVLQTR